MYRCSSILLVALVMAVPARAEYPTYPQPHLSKGREVWLANCEGCHAWGIAGAPLADDAEQWQRRLEKGEESLYRHAIEGFFGPRGTMMPPRGGNESLTDTEVRAAVDYMVRYAIGSDPD